jgi:hypothetical protein
MLKYQKDALLVFLLLAFTYAYFYQDSGDNGDSRFGLTFAIVQERRLTIDTFQARKGTTTQDKAFYDGHYYSDKAIGTSLVAVIFYLPLHAFTWLTHYQLSLPLTKYFLTFCTIGLISAFAGSLMYILCKHISGTRFWAYIVTIAIALGTMCMPYSIVFYSHQLAAALLFCAFFMIFRLKVNLGICQKSSLFFIGFLLGLALITEFPSAVIVLLLMFYYLYVIWKKPSSQRAMSVILPAFGGLIPLVIMLIYNTVCFGGPFSLGYSYGSSQFFRESMAQGVMGIGWPSLKALYYMTLHPAEGLFWQSPVLIMALVGAYFMFRERQYRPEALTVTIAFCSYMVMYSGYYSWWGGWAFGTRGIVPVLPFLCLPLIFAPRRLHFLAVILAIISVAQMFIVAASNLHVPDDFIANLDKLGYFEYSTIYSFCLKQLRHGEYAFNLGNSLLGLKNQMSLIPLVLVNLIVPFVLYFRKPASKPSSIQPV